MTRALFFCLLVACQTAPKPPPAEPDAQPEPTADEAPAPLAYDLAPAILDFGDVARGSSADRVLTVQLVSGRAQSFSFASSKPETFMVVAQNCLAGLAAPQTCDVAVRVLATERGGLDAALTVRIDDSVKSVPLRANITGGDGAPPAPALTLTSEQKRGLTVGAPGTVQVTVKNTSATPVSGLSFASALGAIASTTCSATLLDGLTCTVDVEVTLSELACKHGDVVATYSDGLATRATSAELSACASVTHRFGQRPFAKWAFSAAYTSAGLYVIDYRPYESVLGLRRFTLDGELDTTFARVTLPGYVEDTVWLLPDNQGRLLHVYHTGKSVRVDRRFQDGTLDTSQTIVEGASYAYAATAAIDANDRVLVGARVDGKSVIARASANGGPDATFGLDGVVDVDDPACANDLPAEFVGTYGNTIIATVTCSGATPSRRAIRLDDEGTIDATYAGTGLTLPVTTNRYVTSRAALDSQGRLYALTLASPQTTYQNPPSYLRIARLDENGALDTTFAGGALDIADGAGSRMFTLDRLVELTVAPDDTPRIAIERSGQGSPYETLVLSTDDDGANLGVHTAFTSRFASTRSELGMTQSFVHGDTWFLVGSHERVRAAIAAVDRASGAAVTTFGHDGIAEMGLDAPGTDAENATALIERGGVLYAGVQISRGEPLDAAIVAIAKDGSLVQTFGTGGAVDFFGRQLFSLVSTSGGLYASFISFEAGPPGALVRLGEHGVDEAFASTPIAVAAASLLRPQLVANDTERMLVGINAAQRYVALGFDDTGAITTTFDCGAAAPALTVVALTGETLIARRQKTGSSLFTLERINAAGITPFYAPSAAYAFYEAQVSGDRIYARLSPQQAGYQTLTVALRLDGSLDPSFATNGALYGDHNGLRASTDGELVVLRAYTTPSTYRRYAQDGRSFVDVVAPMNAPTPLLIKNGRFYFVDPYTLTLVTAD